MRIARFYLVLPKYSTSLVVNTITNNQSRVYPYFCGEEHGMTRETFLLRGAI